MATSLIGPPAAEPGALFVPESSPSTSPPADMALATAPLPRPPQPIKASRMVLSSPAWTCGIGHARQGQARGDSAGVLDELATWCDVVLVCAHGKYLSKKGDHQATVFSQRIDHAQLANSEAVRAPNHSKQRTWRISVGLPSSCRSGEKCRDCRGTGWLLIMVCRTASCSVTFGVVFVQAFRSRVGRMVVSEIRNAKMTARAETDRDRQAIWNVNRAAFDSDCESG